MGHVMQTPDLARIRDISCLQKNQNLRCFKQEMKRDSGRVHLTIPEGGGSTVRPVKLSILACSATHTL